MPIETEDKIHYTAECQPMKDGKLFGKKAQCRWAKIRYDFSDYLGVIEEFKSAQVAYDTMVETINERCGFIVDPEQTIKTIVITEHKRSVTVDTKTSVVPIKSLQKKKKPICSR